MRHKLLIIFINFASSSIHIVLDLIINEVYEKIKQNIQNFLFCLPFLCFFDCKAKLFINFYIQLFFFVYLFGGFLLCAFCTFYCFSCGLHYVFFCFVQMPPNEAKTVCHILPQKLQFLLKSFNILLLIHRVYFFILFIYFVFVFFLLFDLIFQ